MCSDWLPHRQRMHTRQTSPATAASEAPTECPCTTACYTQRPCARAVEYSPVLFYCVLIFSILLVYSEMTDPLQKVDEMKKLNEMKELTEMKTRIRNMTNAYNQYYQSVFPDKFQTVCEECDNIIKQLEHWSTDDMKEMEYLLQTLGKLINRLHAHKYREALAQNPDAGQWGPRGRHFGNFIVTEL